MKTIDLKTAADYLHMSPEGLRRLAKKGAVPGRKTGRSWVFVEEHLADWVSGRYPNPERQLQVIDNGKQEIKKSCRFTSGKKLGGSNSPIQTVDEYSSLLGLK